MQTTEEKKEALRYKKQFKQLVQSKIWKCLEIVRHEFDDLVVSADGESVMIQKRFAVGSRWIHLTSVSNNYRNLGITGWDRDEYEAPTIHIDFDIDFSHADPKMIAENVLKPMIEAYTSSRW